MVRAWDRGEEITGGARRSADTGGGTDAMNGSSSYDRSLAAPFGKTMGCVWLVFLAYPALGLLRSDPSPAWLAAGAIGLAVFAGLYLRLAFVGPLPPETARDARARRTGLLARLVTLALLLNVVYGEGGYWLMLFLFCSAVAVAALPGRAATAAVAGLTVVAALAGWAVGAGATLTGTHVLLSGIIGVSQIGHARLTRTVAELRAAREELARLAVAEERLRFARDLHDLLGHSLSLVALKSELAGRLLPGDPGRAAEEVRDVERVAREALREVREAVSGYRKPTLRSELDGAKGMLDAAGVDYRVEDGAGDLPPAASRGSSNASRQAVGASRRSPTAPGASGCASSCRWGRTPPASPWSPEERRRTDDDPGAPRRGSGDGARRPGRLTLVGGRHRDRGRGLPGG